jgi:hypothetical protein
MILLCRSGHNQGQVRLILGNEPNAVNAKPVAVDDVLAATFVVNRPHRAVSEFAISDKGVEIHC